MVKTLPVLCVVFQLIFVSFARAEVSDATHLDQEWRLWLDPKAAWQDDTLYLPEEVNLTNLPVNPPTGGWAVLRRPGRHRRVVAGDRRRILLQPGTGAHRRFDLAIGHRRG